MKSKIDQETIQHFIVLTLLFLIGLSLFFANTDNETPLFFTPFSFIGNQITKPVYNFIQCGKKVETARKLTKENRELRARIAQLKELKKDNEKLKEELNIKSTEEKEKIVGTIIGRSADPNGPIALINKGTKDSVKKGDNVTLPGGIIFGKVVSVYPHHSKVIPITNRSLSVAALHQETRIEGVLKGRAAAKDPVFDLMSPEKELKKGTVLTSGLDQNFIPGLLIGELTELLFYPQESSKRGLVEPAFDFKKVEMVFIISK